MNETGLKKYDGVLHISLHNLLRQSLHSNNFWNFYWDVCTGQQGTASVSFADGIL